MMVKCANDGLLKANDGQMLVNDGEWWLIWPSLRSCTDCNGAIFKSYTIFAAKRGTESLVSQYQANFEEEKSNLAIEGLLCLTFKNLKVN